MKVAASRTLQLVQVVIRNLFCTEEVVESFDVPACAQMRHLLPVDYLKVLSVPAPLDFLKDLDFLKGLAHLLNPVALGFLPAPGGQAAPTVQLGLVEPVQASEHLRALPPVQMAAASHRRNSLYRMGSVRTRWPDEPALVLGL